MSDATYDLPCLGRLENELMRAARRYPRRRLRRFLGFIGALAIVVPVGYATARELIGSDPEQLALHPNDVVTVGFIDPATGLPILCPDGTLLTSTLRAVKADDVDGDAYTPSDPAVCADGSVPKAYSQGLEERIKAYKNAPFGAVAEQLPGGVEPFKLGDDYQQP